jgi:transposase
MKIKDVIGVDVSKLTLDCYIHHGKMQGTFENTPQEIAQMIAWSLENSDADKQSLLFVFEHTGLYSHQLAQCLAEKNCLFRAVSGLEVKRSLGIVRGKDDKADARRIALYGYRTREEARPDPVPEKSLSKLKRLMSMRRKLVAQRAGHIATFGEQQRVLGEAEEPVLFQVQRQLIDVLDQQINVIEKELNSIIKQDPHLQRLYQLLTSVIGIGAVTARFLIVSTWGFTKFKAWRKYASYCGIAPFPNRSGTSLRGKTKVSHLANKRGKALLSLCAGSAIQCCPEMKAYYQRRVENGKNKMSTLNIIRNKLLARAFAVVHRGTPYINTMRYAS